MEPPPFSCPNCRINIPAGTATCPECGEDLSSLLRLELDAYVLYNQGLRLAADGDLEAAVSKIRQAADGLPDRPEPLVLLGRLYARKGDWEQAGYWWEKTLQRWPDQEEALQGLVSLEEHRDAEQTSTSEAQRRLIWRRRGWAVVYFSLGAFIVAFIALGAGAFRAIPQSGPATLTPGELSAVQQTATSTQTPASPTSYPPTLPSTPTPLPHSVTPTAVLPSPTIMPSITPTSTPDLASAVMEIIQSDQTLANLQIRVYQIGSAVWLEGEVPGVDVKYKLESLVSKVPGVTLVDVSRLKIVYTIGSGDTLSHIALQMYGRATLWPLIAQANHMENPHRIYPGTRVEIPPPE